MAYVPPALRKKTVSTGVTSQDIVPSIVRDPTVVQRSRISVGDIQDHFWPRQEVENDEGEKDKTEPHEREDGDDNNPAMPAAHMQHSTLNGTAEEPDRLKYLLLFSGANPRWATDKTIFAKTNLKLLQATNSTTANPSSTLGTESGDVEETSVPPPPAHHEEEENSAKTPNSEPAESSTNPPPAMSVLPLPAGPILVFDENRQRSAGFTFAGYYTLTRIEILEPNSPGLVRMLDQKWTVANPKGFSRPKQRDADSWKRSLNQRWAVLRFEKDEQSTKDLPPPNIVPSTIEYEYGTKAKTKFTGKRGPTKSVNEMLQELRLKGSV